MLNEGTSAPAFSGQDQHGKTISLSDFAGRTLVLYFYPKDDTPGCTAEACSLRDHYQTLLDKGLAVVGVSPDDTGSHQKFAEKYQLPFSLLADPDKTILKAYMAWGLKKNYGKEYEGVIRCTYLINPQGQIQKVFKKVDTKAHAEQILKVL
jgi:peroxiredoxin Q/BCP